MIWCCTLKKGDFMEIIVNARTNYIYCNDCGCDDCFCNDSICGDDTRTCESCGCYDYEE